MNNPIFIFSVNLIIKCWFDYCFLKNYTFHKSTSEFCSFFFFSKSQVRASSEVQTHTNCQALLSCLPRNISLIILLRLAASCGEAGKKGKESALSIFSSIAIFIGIPSGSLCSFIYLLLISSFSESESES